MKHIPTEPVAAKIPDGVEKTTTLSARLHLELSWGTLTSRANHFIQNEKHGTRDTNLAVFGIGIRLPLESRAIIAILSWALASLGPTARRFPGVVAATISIHLFRYCCHNSIMHVERKIWRRDLRRIKLNL